MSNRRKIRETVMQGVYALSVGDQSLTHVLDTIIKPEFREDAFSRDFAERLFLRTVDYRGDTDEIIRNHIANWEIERLAAIDRIILQMAITEIRTFEDIPTKVTINEAIEIAKKFSTARSGRFVNGILDAVVATLDKQGTLNKQGRGLVDVPARRKKRDTHETDDAETGAIVSGTGSHVPDPDPDTDSDAGPGTSHPSDPDSETNTGQKPPKKRRIKRPSRKKNT
ncbi:MAG: transcription antitermination factor NusB [Cyclonatronaceae bacterium]